MTIYYSATTNAFYDSQVYNVNNIPEDKVAVSASTYTNLMAQQCAGRVIVAAADGTPTTIAQTCGSCTSTKYATKTELTNGLAGKANDNAVVHKSGNEAINGVKSFGDIIKATNGAVQVGADTGYSVTFNHNGNITSKQARGTYNIFFPEGSGTLALTSDLDSKANDNNVVHKTGNETINGVKTFNNVIVQKQDGYISNGSIDNTITPSSNLFTHFFFSDKNNIANAFIRYAQGTNGFNEINLFVRDKNLNNYGVSLNTNNEFLPALNNTYSLGSRGLRWADVYSTNDITNKVITYSVTNHNDTSSMTVSGGSSWDKGSTLFLYGNSHSKHPGAFNLTAKNTTNESKLIGYPDGTLQWADKNVALDENLVHRSGNETINGVKYFGSLVYLHNNMANKNSQMDLFTTPANTLYSNYMFVDKNDEISAYMQYGQQNTGTDFIGLFIHDKNRTLHGIQVTNNKEFIPFYNNVYNLGSPNNKWANVYASEINTKYFTHTHDSMMSYIYLPKHSGTLAIQERTRASAVVENRTLLYECAGGLDAGDITLGDMYTKYNALVIVYSNDDSGGICTYYLDCAELDIRRQEAGSGTFLLVDGHFWWACTGASTGTKFVHSKNNGLKIHKIYGLAKYY